MKKYLEKGSYRGITLSYVQLRLDNAPHFICYNKFCGKYFICDGKKKLFIAMLDRTFNEA
jgi:hypothetical protein